MNPGGVQFIINPIAGSSRRGGLVADLRRRFGRRGDVVAEHTTRSAGDARRLAAELDARTRLVVVFGGDGTVNEVADGLCGRDIPILIVPCGTENLLARVLGLRPRGDELFRAVEDGAVRPFDLGVVNGRRFLSVVGVGFDAEVVRRLEARRRRHITHLDYLAPIWRTFWQWSFPPLRVIADGRTIFDGRGLAFVGNTARYSIGLRILREARPDDGLLDVCVFACGSQARLLAHSLNTLLRRHVGRADVTYQQAREVRVESARPLPVEVDGDLYGQTPIQASVMPAAVRLVSAAAPG